MSPRFSAAAVAGNEEALVRRCLESVAWCDERILIDMDSVDRTRELATPLATKIVPQERIPQMEWARNRGTELATGYRDGVAGLVLSVLFAFYRVATEAKRWEAARYPREGDATVRRLGSLPRLAAVLTDHGLRRLWARRSVR
jgi:glycosyltransferase involved in cell wall biosynthesis